MADLSAEQSELLEEVVASFPGATNLRTSLVNLFEAQNHLQGLSGRLTAAGIKSSDALSVGVYVEIQTALEAQAHHERTVNLMVMLALNAKIMDVAGNTATIALTYKAVLDEITERARAKEDR